MKFTDGYWNLRTGVTVSSPVEVRDVVVENKSITVYAACKHVLHRGDTLNAPLLTLEFSSPRADMIRVRATHYAGGVVPKPSFEIRESADVPVETGVCEQYIYLRSGSLEVRVHKAADWRVDYYLHGRRITGNSAKSTGYAVDADGTAYLREQLDLGVGELVYGLGERFTPFVKNGQTVDIWNEDGGTSSEQAYKNIPFYLTSRGYGVFVNHPERVSFEVQSENVSRVQFSVPGETLEYFIIGGASAKEALQNYTALTGRPALPPAWSFGLWLTTSFTTSYDEATVTSFIEGMKSRDVPLHVFHFDCFWMKEYQWCDFVWDSAVFPDPAGMLARLKEKGLHVCVWINPYIAQKSCLFREGNEEGYFVLRRDGSVWQWDKWQAGMALVDFTNPEAAAWYQSKLKALLDMGVDCFKTDFGERIPVDVTYFDGSDPTRMHNYYTLLYNKCVFELLERERGKNEAVVFARSATVGSQQYPAHWGGDCAATYESMAETLRGGLSLAMSGFSFWSHDISGFESTATPDLFKRWAAFGLLSTHSRLHGNESYRVPWNFDEEAVDVLRFFTKLKCTLMPYLFAAACRAAETGLPVLRAMSLEFPDDPACGTLDRQYMLGDSLLVAPIFSPDGAVQYYLPEGTWTNFITGEKTQGRRWVNETHGYRSLPLMVRPGSIVPVGAIDFKPDYDYSDGVTFHVFEPVDSACSRCVVPALDGTPVMTLEMMRSGTQLQFKMKGAAKAWSVLLRGVFDAVAAKGAEVEITGLGALIRAGAAQAVSVSLTAPIN